MKKVFLIILSIVLALSVYSPYISVMAADEEDYKVASGLLSALEIMPEGYDYGINSGMRVTRAKFLMMVMKAMKIPLIEDNQLTFADVNPRNAEAKYISTSAAIGLVNGFGDGTFRPDDEISVTDCLKIAIEAAGYGEVAKRAGGYPLGYITIANKQDITEGLDGDYNDSALMNEARMIVYNMLHAEWVSSYEVNGEIVGSTDSDRSILNVLYNVYEASGIVTGSEETLLNSTEGTKKGYIEIDGDLYTAGEADKDLLGYAVDFYYKEAKNGTKELVYILPSESNRDVIYNAYEISQYSKGTYTFWDGNKRVTERVPGTADIIYNGRALIGNTDDSVFQPDAGSITLIDNNSDGKYDVVKIINKRTVVVDSVDTEKYIVYDRLAGSGITLEFEDYISVNTIVDIQGQSLELGDIARNDVVDLILSADRMVSKLVVCGKTVSGTLDGINEDPDDASYTVNENTYSLNPDFVASAARTGRKPRLGGYYKFLLTGDGEIAWFEQSDSGEAGKYGCLIKAMNDDNGFESKVLLKVLTADNKVEVLEFDKKLKVNGSAMIENTDAFSLVEPLLFDESGDMVPLIIYYEMNNEGKIRYIETPNAPNPASADASLHLAGTAINTFHTSGANCIGGRVTYDSETIFFIIPQDMETMADKDMRAVKLSEYARDAQIFQRIEGYAREKNAAISRVALSRESAVDRYESALFMLTGISKSLDESGIEKYKLSGLRNGVPTVYMVSEDEVFLKPEPFAGMVLPSSLREGDLLRLGTGQSGEITNIAVIYSPSRDIWYLQDNPTSSGVPFSADPLPVDNLKDYYLDVPKGGGHYRAEFRIFAANVYSKTETHIRAINSMYDLDDPRVMELVDSGAIGIENHAADSGNVFVYQPEMRGDVYTRGDIGLITSLKDHSAPSKVIIYTEESMPRAIIVYP